MDTIKTLLEAQQKLSDARKEELQEHTDRQIVLAQLHIAEAIRMIECGG